MNGYEAWHGEIGQTSDRSLVKSGHLLPDISGWAALWYRVCAVHPVAAHTQAVFDPGLVWVRQMSTEFTECAPSIAGRRGDCHLGVKRIGDCEVAGDDAVSNRLVNCIHGALKLIFVSKSSAKHIIVHAFDTTHPNCYSAV